MLKKVLSLLIVLMLLMAYAGPAAAVGDHVHQEAGGGSGEGDPGGGDTSPAKDDDPEIFIFDMYAFHYISTGNPIFGLLVPIKPYVRSSFESNIPASMQKMRIDASNATGDK